MVKDPNQPDGPDLNDPVAILRHIFGAPRVIQRPPPLEDKEDATNIEDVFELEGQLWDRMAPLLQDGSAQASLVPDEENWNEMKLSIGSKYFDEITSSRNVIFVRSALNNMTREGFNNMKPRDRHVWSAVLGTFIEEIRKRGMLAITLGELQRGADEIDLDDPKNLKIKEVSEVVWTNLELGQALRIVGEALQAWHAKPNIREAAHYVLPIIIDLDHYNNSPSAARLRIRVGKVLSWFVEIVDILEERRQRNRVNRA